MKLDTAYACYSCREIQDRAPTGACFNCGSENIQPLGWLGRKRAERVWNFRIRQFLSATEIPLPLVIIYSILLAAACFIAAY